MNLWHSKLSLAILLWIPVLSAPATSIELVILDGADFGFNDLTPVAPLPSNPGTTLGQQRANVLQRAGEIWAAYLHSDVPIRVECEFENLGGTPEGYALAGASPVSVVRNFPNAPLANTWYPVALANSLAGEDLSGSNDIYVRVNIAPDTFPDLPPWYYGLDGNAPPGTTDLLDVLLHELGHGMGFTSFVDLQLGKYLERIPDVFTLQLYDTELAAGWGDMNSKQIKDSALNDPDLTWSGAYTSAAKNKMLQRYMGILVTAPASLEGEYAYEPAYFGPPVPEGGLSGELVVVNDGVAPQSDACDPLPAGSLTDKIAYIDRGSCYFDAKVLNAQLAGAKAVIIANNVLGQGTVAMSGSDVVDGIPLTIPAVSISMEDGMLLASEPGVQLTVGVETALLAGATDGFVRMYAPPSLELGSSVSHWSTAATPDLLMEPFINPVLRDDLDLSLTLMKDIGWVVIDIPFPYLTYPLWAQEVFPAGAPLTAQSDDADGDGLLNIEEYFFGGDPLVPSVDRLPVLQQGDTAMEFSFTRATFFTDLAWGYEVSSDMTTWGPPGEGDIIEEQVEALGGSAERVRLRIVPPVPGGKFFVRLRILPE